MKNLLISKENSIDGTDARSKELETDSDMIDYDSVEELNNDG